MRSREECVIGRSRHGYCIAALRVDTAEHEPSEICGCGKLYMAINERDQNADFVESGEFWEELGVSLVVKPDFAMKRLSESFQVFQASRTAKSMWGKGATMQSAQFYMKFLKPEISEGDK